MTADPRAALDRLVAALEAHFHAVSARRDPEDTAVDNAYDALADAFDIYDDALSEVYGEATPLVLDEDEEDEEDDDGREGPSGHDIDRVPDEAFDDGDDDGFLDDYEDDDEDAHDASEETADTDPGAVR